MRPTEALESALRLELGSDEAIKQAILAGLGISALSRHALARSISPASSLVIDVDGDRKSVV